MQTYPEHIYRPSSMPGRGVHVFTTLEHDEAAAMFHAVRLRDALRDVLSWRDQIIGDVAAAHGLGPIHDRIASDFHNAEAVLSAATMARRPAQ